MPLPSDEKLIALSEALLQQMEALFGQHPGFRPAHAKGILLSGSFTPSAEARTLTRAPHMSRESTPVWARFSNATGLPLLPDNNPNANPHGLAIRFYLAEHVHTDIVSHATDGFPTRTGEEFLEFLRAVGGSGDSQSSPSPIEQFLATHPAALAFVQAPKPTPSSFAKEQFFGINAFRFTAEDGSSRYGRYRIVPEAGTEHLDAEAVKDRDVNFLFDELRERVAASPVRFRIQVQLAQDGDVVDDATVHWPEDRQLLDAGTVVLTGVVPDNEAQQKKTIFDPIPRVDGIEPSNDPLLELRAAVYLISGRRRRQAPEAQPAVAGH